MTDIGKAMTKDEKDILTSALLSEIGTAQKYNRIVAELQSEIARLREAIHRLADQDATLSVRGGIVTVTMDATLTKAEREAVRVARDAYADDDGNAECEHIAAVLSGLLDRLK